jgi:hypothetical protein
MKKNRSLYKAVLLLITIFSPPTPSKRTPYLNYYSNETQDNFVLLLALRYAKFVTEILIATYPVKLDLI